MLSKSVKLRKRLKTRNYERSTVERLQKPKPTPLDHPPAHETLRHDYRIPRMMPPPFFNQIADAWLENAALNLKKSSYSTYYTIVTSHLKPHFCSSFIEEITTEAISAFLACVTAKGLAQSTVRGIASVLRSILQFAENEGYRVSSTGCTVRRKDHIQETRILDDAEWRHLEGFLKCDMDPVKLGTIICMYTGIRLGEMCALKWEDISFETGTLTVRRTVQRIRNTDLAGPKTKVVFDAPKSLSSNRSIPLPGFLLSLLKEYKSAKNCYVLTGEPDVFIEPRTFQNRFKGLLRQASVGDINFHALRHTFATKCVNLGFDVKTLSEILGHSDVSVTLNTYVHPSLSLKKTYMERLDCQ